jgi:hypothetical protein
MLITRTPRFKRPTKTNSIRITERDLNIIHYVFKYRLLNSKQIATLTEGSHQNLLRRLKLLYNNQYLDRPIGQLEYYRSGGSLPIVYALGNRGADLIQEKFNIPRQDIDWTAKNRSVKRLFIQHTLAVSEFLVKMEADCIQSGNMRFVDKEESLTNLSSSALKHRQFKWNVKVSAQGENIRIGIIPDYVFGLQPLEKNAETIYYFLEVDRGTMPVMRNNLKQTSFYRKLLAYYETWRQGLHTSFFGVKRFRVLIVTNSKERMNHMIDANKLLKDGNGSGIFLIGNVPDIYSCKDILKQSFMDGRGNVGTSLE